MTQVKDSGKTAQGQEQGHTPGPWSVARFDDEDSDCIIGPNGDERICEMRGNQWNEHNARRIVACVNACEGIPTSELEITPTVGRIQAERQTSILAAENLRQERDHLAALNKELEEALQRATNMRPALLMTLGYVPEPVLEFCDDARSVLSKVKP